MAKQTINIGTTANDGTGDAIRAAFGKVNDNFTEIYTANTGVNTGDQNLSAYATTAAVAAGYQPLDSDLTAISALTTTAYGRALLSTADAATLRSAIGVGTTDAPTFLTVASTNDASVNGLTVGKGGGSVATNLAVGESALAASTSGGTNIAIGTEALQFLTGAGSANNIAIGYRAAKINGVAGNVNGFQGGIFIGHNAKPIYNGGNNQIVIGNNATSLGDGSCLIGGTGITRVVLTGTVGIGADDTYLVRDAPGILAQRNGTSAQAFRVYRTTDGTNKEYFHITWAGDSSVYVGPNTEGTGVFRDMRLVGSSVIIRTYGTDRWTIPTTGHFLAAADNTYDIGASGANRPRNVYAGSDVISRPSASITPANNGQFVVEATSNTTLTLKLKGTDGTVRSVALTLA